MRGPLQTVLEGQAQGLGCPSRVEFAGALPRVELVDLLDEVSRLVLPSRSEGLGRVILEVMARGRAVVASRVGGIPELVQDGLTGSLVPPGGPGRLGEALAKVLQDRSLAGAWAGSAGHWPGHETPIES